MKITVIVHGRFHGFDMASFFEKEGVLNELVTGYPQFIAIRFGISRKFIKSLYINEIINRVSHALFKSYPLDFMACEAFDYIASRTIKYDSDVYFIWSGVALKTIKRIRKKNKNAKIILVRGSAHISTQDELLKMISTGEKNIISRKMINKELSEYAAADYITVPSTFAYNSFIEHDIPRQKLFLNLLGVNLASFPFYKKEISARGLVVGNVGKLSSQKNVASIINVIEKLNKKGNKIKLILAGAIDHDTFDKQLLKRDFIDYRGKLPQHKLHEVYSEMDLFVINSVHEGLAMVQLQAMSCGLPIISTVNAGGLDLVKDGINGFTIPILDESELENKILWFYNNKSKIPEMGGQSHYLTLSGLTWDDFGKRNLEFVKKITVA